MLYCTVLYCALLCSAGMCVCVCVCVLASLFLLADTYSIRYMPIRSKYHWLIIIYLLLIIYWRISHMLCSTEQHVHGPNPHSRGSRFTHTHTLCLCLSVVSLSLSVPLVLFFWQLIPEEERVPSVLLFDLPARCSGKMVEPSEANVLRSFKEVC